MYSISYKHSHAFDWNNNVTETIRIPFMNCQHQNSGACATQAAITETNQTSEKLAPLGIMGPLFGAP